MVDAVMDKTNYVQLIVTAQSCQSTSAPKFLQKAPQYKKIILRFNKMKLPYPPAKITDFFAYYYEFIDCSCFLKNPHDVIDNYDSYEPYIIEKINKIDGSEGFYWEKTSDIQILWIPPFAMTYIIENGITQFKDIQGIHYTDWEDKKDDLERGIDKQWSMGLILFHVKDPDTGASLLLSPFKLSIPTYGLTEMV